MKHGPKLEWQEGLSDGEWIELRRDEDTVARLVVIDGAYSGPIPSQITELVAVANGYSDGEPDLTK